MESEQQRVQKEITAQQEAEKQIELLKIQQEQEALEIQQKAEAEKLIKQQEEQAE